MIEIQIYVVRSLDLIQVSARRGWALRLIFIHSLCFPVCGAMAPKRSGGKSIDYVVALRRRGFDDEAIRSDLKADGFRKARISQLLRALREREQPGVAAGAGSSRDDALMDASVQELAGDKTKTILYKTKV